MKFDRVFVFLPLITFIEGSDKLLRVPINKRADLVKRDSFSTSLFNDFGKQYIVNMSVGTPPQNFSVLLDTGSADMWIPGPNCANSDCPFNKFEQIASSTFTLLNKKFALDYGKGSVNGTYATDTVSIAGATVVNQQFGLASNTESVLTLNGELTNISSVVANGVLGLGFPRLTYSGDYNPFVFSLVSQNIITEPVFSVYLNKVDANGWSGEIIFGGIDSTKYQGNITYLSVSSLYPTSTSSTFKKSKRGPIYNNVNAYWIVGAKGYSLQDTANATNSLDVTFPSVGGYILDTGTTLTYLDADKAEYIVKESVSQYRLEPKSGAYIVDCHSVSKTKNFVLKMTDTKGGDPVEFSVPIYSMLVPYDGLTLDDATKCLFGIAPLNSAIGNNVYVIGESVLRQAYLVFDMGKKRVGFAAGVGVSGSIQGVTADTSDAIVNRAQSTNIVFVFFVTVLTLMFAL